MSRGVEVHMCSFTSKQHLKVLQKQREKQCVDHFLILENAICLLSFTLLQLTAKYMDMSIVTVN